MCVFSFDASCFGEAENDFTEGLDVFTKLFGNEGIISS